MYPASFIPLDTMASAISFTVLASIFSANLFQLFQPMGGVRANCWATHTAAKSKLVRDLQIIDSMKPLFDNRWCFRAATVRESVPFRYVPGTWVTKQTGDIGNTRSREQ